MGPTAGLLGVTILVALVALLALQRQLPLPLPKSPPPQLLGMFRLFVRYAIVGITLAAPLPAIALASLAARAPRPPSG